MLPSLALRMCRIVSSHCFKERGREREERGERGERGRRRRKQKEMARRKSTIIISVSDVLVDVIDVYTQRTSNHHLYLFELPCVVSTFNDKSFLFRG
jgi:hypothetical protein